jgi:hypothetical protein
MVPKSMQSLEQPCSVEFTSKNPSVVKLSGLSISEVQLVMTQLMGSA